MIHFKTILYFALLWVLLPTNLFAQNNRDSLRKILATHLPTDSLYVLAKIDLANELRYDAPDTALNLATEALALAQKQDFTKAMGRANRIIGVCYRNAGNHEKALTYFKQSEKAAQASNDKEGLAFTYNSIAAIYKNQANSPLAIEYCQKALQQFEALGDKKGAAYVFNNLADIYTEQGDYAKGLAYAQNGLQYNEEINNTKGLFYSNFNIAEIYRLQKQHSKALAYQLKNMALAEQNKDQSDMIYACNQIGSSYMALYDHEKALPYLQKALQLSQETKNTSRLTVTQTNLAQWHKNKQQYAIAFDYAQKALTNAQTLAKINLIESAALQHSEIAALQGNYAMAYKSHLLYKKMADSLQNEKNVRASLQKEFTFAEEQHKLEQQKSELSHLAALQQQKTMRNGVLVALALMILVAFLGFRSYFIKKKSNLLLEEQKVEIKIANDGLNQMNEELHQQQEELMMLNENLGKQKKELETTYTKLKTTSTQLDQSISYASDIQAIVQPTLQDFLNYFQAAFIIYKPRDVVSGDFYWLSQLNEQQAVFALADCTGHGVPGAFMSMLGCTLLHEIVNIKQVHDDPARILRNLNAAFQRILKQESSNNRDGMDISVCFFDKQSNEKTIKMVFAGAKTQFYYAANEELVHLHGDKLYLGGRGKAGEFTNQTHLFAEKVQCYFFTDGYIDQNNEEREKLGSARLRQALQTCQHLPPIQQEQHLTHVLAAHQAQAIQRDDISFVYLGLAIAI